jgi:hypothetical protein
MLVGFVLLATSSFFASTLTVSESVSQNVIGRTVDCQRCQGSRVLFSISFAHSLKRTKADHRSFSPAGESPKRTEYTCDRL